MSSRVAQMVREFHVKLGYLAGDKPTIPDDDLVELRVRLLAEEFKEYTDAQRAGDLIGVADGLADIVYVAYGTAITHGINLDAVIAEVHRSNMTKTNNGSGKAFKGPNYSPPNVAAVLTAAGDGAGETPAATGGETP